MEPMKAGDLVFAHSKGIIAKAIRFGEWLRGGERRKGSTWNHVAVLSHQVDGIWYVIQAEAKGVSNDKCLSSVAPGGHYEVVPLPAGADRGLFNEFVKSQVGSKYGYVSIASCVVDILLPDSICLRRSKTWICSGLAAAGLMYAGWEGAQEWAKADIYTTMPSEVHTKVILS